MYVICWRRKIDTQTIQYVAGSPDRSMDCGGAQYLRSRSAYQAVTIMLHTYKTYVSEVVLLRFHENNASTGDTNDRCMHCNIL